MATKGGKAFLDWGVLRDNAENGYLAVSISLPGYGGSSDRGILPGRSLSMQWRLL